MFLLFTEKHTQTRSTRVFRYLFQLSGLATLLFVVYLISTDESQAQNTTTNSLAHNCDLEKGSGPGYVVALHIFEQLTKATSNLLQLQCWAARYNLGVVMPTVIGSRFSFSFNKALPTVGMDMEQLFDVNQLREYTDKKGLAPLVPQQEFSHDISHHKRNAILVSMEYGDRKEGPCSYKWDETELANIQKTAQLEVTRRVCIKMASITGSVDEFDKTIYGDLCPKDSVVIIDLWKGIAHHRNPDRVNIDLDCSDAETFSCDMALSPRLLKDAEDYAHKYLGTGLGEYNAIMARFERMNSIKKDINKHVDQVIAKWKDMKKKTATTFLAFDYGTFGSDTFRSNNYYDSKVRLEDLHHIIYGGRLSFQEWEKSFSEISHTNHSGYIALLQLQLVAHAKCVVFASDKSSFVQHAFHLYEDIHPHNKCIETIGTFAIGSCRARSALEVGKIVTVVILVLLIVTLPLVYKCITKFW